ncbi:M23 family metallopeptidase [Domibacillus epiphyticus]|nr:M23 family metallopeptidase [Domibacillus epiphyticus]
MKKRALPAIYLACAILLISSLMMYQVMDRDEDKTAVSDPAPASNEFDDSTISVNANPEQMSKPAEAEVIVKTSFYDEKAATAEQQKALVVYNDTYYESAGVDYVLESGKTFSITAPLSGTVIDVREDAFLGNHIEIDHGNNVVTTFQSVADIQVKKGDKVSQGEKIGEAGRSLMNESAGVHVHFEVEKDGKMLDPNSLYGKTVSEWK